MEVTDIAVADIEISEFNTRKDLRAGTEDASLDDLASSIQENGLLNPVLLRPRLDGKFDLVAGQRRFLACNKLGMDTIPAIVRDQLNDDDATVVSLVENVHRAEMNPIDKARAYQAIQRGSTNDAEVARKAGVTIATVRKYVKLLELTTTLQDRLTTATGPAGLATMSKLAETFSPDEQEEALEEIEGFTQDIQLQMLKKSKGSLGALSDLQEEALSGAFNVQTCREGLCFKMPADMKSEVKERLAGTGAA